jgi:hypothetical protein
VIGLSRDAATGGPVGGITIESQKADTTDAVIRYLNEDKTAFDATETASHGLFVIVSPDVPEKFDVYQDGELLEDVEATAGTAKDAIFALVLDV